MGNALKAAVVVCAFAAPLATAASPAAAAGPTVALRDTFVGNRPVGEVLVTGDNRTLYQFEGDSRSRSNCTGFCSLTWSPLLAAGQLTAGSGADQSKLGSIRRGSRRQVTYAGHPLYTYAGDWMRGLANGEELRQYGSSWFVTSVSGQLVHSST